MDKELYRCNKVVVRYLAFSPPTCNSSYPCRNSIRWYHYSWILVRLGLEDVPDAGLFWELSPRPGSSFTPGSFTFPPTSRLSEELELSSWLLLFEGGGNLFSFGFTVPDGCTCCEPQLLRNAANLSGGCFSDEKFGRHIWSILERHKIPSKNIFEGLDLGVGLDRRLSNSL